MGSEYGLVGVAPDDRTRKGFDAKLEDCVARSSDGTLGPGSLNELGVDPGKVIVQVSSNGGHEVGWTAIQDPVTSETASDPVPDPTPMGLILLWPVTDTGTNGYGGPKRFNNNEARANNLSVTRRMPAKMPPTLVLHGTGDKTVKFESSKAFTKKMKTKIEEESLKFLEKLGSVSREQAPAGVKTTNKEDGG